MHVVLLAHGSRESGPAERARSLAAAVAADRPDDTIHVAFLDHCAPTLADVLAPMPAGTDVVVVPLLLTAAFHAVTDVPAVVHEQRPDLAVRTTPTLGPSPALTTALVQRLVEAGASPGDEHVAVLVVGVGSSDAAAQAQVASVTTEWEPGRWRGTHAFATGEPAVAPALRSLHEAGATRIVLAPYMLFGGALLERAVVEARAAAAETGVELIVADVLSDARDIVTLVIERIGRAAS